MNSYYDITDDAGVVVMDSKIMIKATDTMFDAHRPNELIAKLNLHIGKKPVRTVSEYINHQYRQIVNPNGIRYRNYYEHLVFSYLDIMWYLIMNEDEQELIKRLEQMVGYDIFFEEASHRIWTSRDINLQGKCIRALCTLICCKKEMIKNCQIVEESYKMAREKYRVDKYLTAALRIGENVIAHLTNNTSLKETEDRVIALKEQMTKLQNELDMSCFDYKVIMDRYPHISFIENFHESTYFYSLPEKNRFRGTKKCYYDDVDPMDYDGDDEHDDKQQNDHYYGQQGEEECNYGEHYYR